MIRHLSAALLLLATVAVPALAAEAPPGYHLVRAVPLGVPDHWDYVMFDAASQRVFVAHGSEITVVDAGSGTILGRVLGIDGAHGIATVPALGRGYASNGRSGRTTVFDLDTLKPIAAITGDLDADPVVFDPTDNRVFVMNGDSRSVTVIDPATDTAVATIPLPGPPEYAVADGKGSLFVNITDRHAIARIAHGAVTALWTMPGCERPHGLAMDTETRRLFSTCANGRMVVVDADNGGIVATLDIGRGSDAAAFDPVRRRAFSSNGDGTLSIVREAGADSFAPAASLATRPGARTMALDPASGRLFLVTAEALPSDPPAAPDGKVRRTYKPGTVTLLMLDPDSADPSHR